MKLEREIPKHKKTEHFNWCKKNFIEMSQSFRKIRSRSKNPMDKCYWCKYAFKDGEMMALAQTKKGKNRVLCQKCAEILLSSGIVILITKEG